MSNLNAHWVMTLRVEVGEPLVVGDATHGVRRVVPISGGSLEGEGFEGVVLPGGADWQYVRADGVLVIEARYTLKGSDGTLIMITNRGLRHASAQVMRQLADGEPVDPASYYFRTVAEFDAPRDSAYAWLNQRLFVGVAERAARVVTVRLYQID